MSTTDFNPDAKFEFGRVVSRTFGLIGRNFVPFWVLSLFFVGVPQFAILYAQYTVGVADPSLMLTLIWGGILVSMITTFVLQGALTRAAIDDLSGNGVKFGAAIADGLRYFFPLLIVGILAGLGTGLGFLIFVIPGIMLAVRWVVSAPIVVVEKEGPTSALGRAAELTKGNRWAIFGLILLYVALSWVVQIVIVLLVGAAAGQNQSMIGDIALSSLVLTVATALVTALLSLVSTLGAASLYFELRRVKEGVSVDDLAKVFE